MQNFVEIYRKYFSCCKKVAFRVWAQELVLGQLRLQDLQSHKYRTLYPIFAHKASFYADF